MDGDLVEIADAPSITLRIADESAYIAARRPNSVRGVSLGA